jgi:hypothetical protein
MYFTFNALERIKRDLGRGIISTALRRQIQHTIQFTDFCIPEQQAFG